MSRYIAPDPETLIAVHPETGAKLYAWLSDVPLYLRARMLPGFDGQFGRRKSFHMGYVIDDKRFARNHAMANVPADLIAWADSALQEVYPSVAEATGLDANEINELKAEQSAKRAKYAKPK